MTSLESLRYDPAGPTMEVLDQLLIPHETKYLPIKSTEDAWSVIRKMQIRGEEALCPCDRTTTLQIISQLHSITKVHL